MGAAHLLSLAMFQSGDAAGTDHLQWIMIFVGVLAFCSLVQFLVFAVAGIVALKEWKKISAEIDIVKQKAYPLIASVQDIVKDATPKVQKITASVQDLMADVSPKVKTITSNVTDISNVAREKVHAFEQTLDHANETVRMANDKTRAQVDRVDGMVSSALKATSDVGNTIHRGIRAPIVEVAGVVNGIKAALDVLVGRGQQRPPANRAWGDAGRSYSPGPVPVPASEPEFSSHPSSNVAPSPGAAAVVDRFRSDKVKTIY